MTQMEEPAVAAEQPASREKLQVEVRKARPAESADLAAMFARAFDDDPVLNWFVKQGGGREERMRRFFHKGLERITMPHDETYTDDGYHGGAQWTPPGRWKMGFFQQLALMPSMGACIGWTRVPKVMSGMSAVDKKHPHKPHYYLLALGTEPDHQGKGVGTQMMAPILQRCDQQGIPAYLESSKEKNLPLYERNGFRVTEEFVIPHGGPRVWLMWREPQ